MDSNRSQQHPWRWLQPWVPFGVVAVLCVLLWGFDRQLKRADHVGFLAPDPSWHVVATDLPEFWERLERCEAYIDFQAGGPPFAQEAALAFRKATGIRPTPWRLRLWLGAGALMSGDSDSWCLSFRPGVAMRVASGIHRVFSTPTEPGARRWGNLFYGWRDGYLLVSTSAPYLAAALEAGEAVRRTDGVADGLVWNWHGDQPGELTLYAREELPFRLKLDALALPDTSELTYTHSWPEAMAVANFQGAEIPQILRAAAESIVYPLFPAPARDVWKAVASAWWSAQVPPAAPIECGGELAWIAELSETRGKGNAIQFGQLKAGCVPTITGAIGELDQARPYGWEDQQGWLVISPRHEAPLAVCGVGDRVALANDPLFVPILLDGQAGTPVGGVAYVRLRWEEVMNLTRRILVDVAEKELIPGTGPDDIRRDWMPYLDGFSTWDLLVATGEKAGGGISIEGRLTAQDEP